MVTFLQSAPASNNSGQTSLSATFSSAPSVGNLLLMFAVASSGTMNTPAGWSLVTSVATGHAQTKAYSRVVQTGDGTGYSISASSAILQSLVIVEVKGQATVSPINVYSSAAATSTSATPSVLGCLAVASYSCNSNPSSVTAGSGYTSLTSATTSNYHSLWIETGNSVSSDIVTPVPSSFTVSGGSEPATILLLIAPASTTAGVPALLFAL